VPAAAGRAANRRRGVLGQEGTTLIETAIAITVLLVLTLGLLGLTSMATTITENEGHLTARTTEYAQDKMEQLLALKYGDAQSDTTVFPATTSGGTGLAIGGSANTSAPAAGYVDYLDVAGTPLTAVGTTAPSGWFYRRVWQVASAGTNLKRITVTTIVAHSVGQMRPPQATVAALKVSPF
jgi:Tfp pilus assembly protein PilV